MIGKLDQIQGFSEFAGSRNQPSKPKILKREILKNASIAKELLMAEKADLVYIKRLFEIVDVPIVIDEAWLPAERFPDLLVKIEARFMIT